MNNGRQNGAIEDGFGGNNPVAQENPHEEYPFEIEKLEIIETLSTDDIDSFLNDSPRINLIGYTDDWVIKSPDGMGIKLTYDDGNFTLITVIVVHGIDSIFVGEYDAGSKIKGYFGVSEQKLINDFKALVNEYFVSQI